MSKADLSKQISDLLPALKRYARFLARNETDADDLVQDCVERAIRNHRKFQEGTNLNAWLNTIMRNTFINKLRHDKIVRQHVQHESLADTNSTPASQMDHMELKEVVQACEQLSGDHKKAIELLCIKQVSYKEAARQMKVREATAKTRLFRAREKLRMQFAA